MEIREYRLIGSVDTYIDLFGMSAASPSGFAASPNLLDREQKEQTSKQLYGVIQRACRQDNAAAVNHALLKWAQLEWSDYPPRKLAGAWL